MDWKWEDSHGSAITPDPNPKNIDNMLRINKRFMGGGMSQNYGALYLFEYYMQQYKFRYVCEIGSQKGALSLFFANMAGVTEQFLFETFEINQNRDWYNRSAEGCGHWFDSLQAETEFIAAYELDVFSDRAVEIIQRHVDGLRPSLIICDGGNKPREIKTFAPMLKPGDRIVVHDWDHEIHPSDVQSLIDRGILSYDKPYADYFDDLRTLFKPFVRL